jgi:hypothetical protein
LRQSIVIFFLTSFFNNSIHQLVAVKHRCTFSMKNGRENRNNGNQEKGKEEKEALSKFSTKSKRGRSMRPLSFWWSTHCRGFCLDVNRPVPLEIPRRASDDVGWYGVLRFAQNDRLVLI